MAKISDKLVDIIAKGIYQHFLNNDFTTDRITRQELFLYLFKHAFPVLDSLANEWRFFYGFIILKLRNDQSQLNMTIDELRYEKQSKGEIYITDVSLDLLSDPPIEGKYILEISH